MRYEIECDAPRVGWMYGYDTEDGEPRLRAKQPERFARAVAVALALAGQLAGIIKIHFTLLLHCFGVATLRCFMYIF